MGKKLKLIGGTYDYDYADGEDKWELVRYDEKAEEWECMGVYCKSELLARELSALLNVLGEKIKWEKKV